MQWEFIVALAIAIPIILLPAAFIWYLVIVGFYARTKEAQERRTAVRRLVGEALQIIRNKQILNRSILEAIESAEKTQTDLGGGARQVGRHRSRSVQTDTRANAKSISSNRRQSGCS